MCSLIWITSAQISRGWCHTMALDNEGWTVLCYVLQAQFWTSEFWKQNSKIKIPKCTIPKSKFTNLIFLPLTQNVFTLINNNCWSNPWHIICWSNHWQINFNFKIHEVHFPGIFSILISLRKFIHPISRFFPLPFPGNFINLFFQIKRQFQAQDS